jgi:rhodanese-related sulfurtransferase
MQTIDRDTLKAKLDRGDHFTLFMALGEWAYLASHIPGSVFFPTYDESLRALKPDDEIVVYCAGGDCSASRYAYHVLTSRGYRHVYHYPGGLADWAEAGYPLEGEMTS